MIDQTTVRLPAVNFPALTKITFKSDFNSQALNTNRLSLICTKGARLPVRMDATTPSFIRRKLSIAFVSMSMLLAQQSNAQYSSVNQSQCWFGYMTSTEISERFSWWNDFHYVPEGFLIVRTGLTRKFKKVSLTGGYAHAWLSAGGSKQLARNENRPWGQIQFTSPVGKTLTFTQRTRYDARFKQNVLFGETIDSYTFNNRIRFMGSLKKSFPGIGNEQNIPFVTLSDEILFNFGKNISGFTLDQNRIYFTVGLQKSNVQFQVGYMNRLVQSGPDQYIQNHTLLIWITQKINFRNMIKKIVSDKPS